MAAPSAVQLYAEILNVIKLTDLPGAAVKLALLASTYTPDTDNAGHSVWGDVSANEIAAGNGYTAGGQALAGMAVADFSTTGYKFSSNNVLWTASGGSIPAWRYGVFYIDTNPTWGLNKPLIGIFTGDSAPADVPATSNGNGLQITCPANGWFTSTRT